MSSIRLVLADSSAWISHLVGRKSAVTDALGPLLEDHRIATNDVIRMEVLTGARDEAQYGELSDQWEGLHPLPITAAVWRRAERLRFDLRRKGRLIPLSDVLIASSAIVYHCELLHADRHFDQIAAMAPLKLFNLS